MNMRDVREHDGRYHFRVGKGNGFGDTIHLIKTTFRPQERDYDDNTKEWSVPATELNEAKLAMIFSNAESVFEYLHAQFPLF